MMPRRVPTVHPDSLPFAFSASACILCSCIIICFYHLTGLPLPSSNELQRYSVLSFFCIYYCSNVQTPHRCFDNYSSLGFIDHQLRRNCTKIPSIIIDFVKSSHILNRRRTHARSCRPPDPLRTHSTKRELRTAYQFCTIPAM